MPAARTVRMRALVHTTRTYGQLIVTALYIL